MLFDKSAYPSRNAAHIKSLPPIQAEIDWRPPTVFPELRDAMVIGFDVETKENDFEYGPGWGRAAGYIVGVGIAAMWSDGRTFRHYYPVRHTVCVEDNLDSKRVFGWLHEQLSSSVPKTGANLLYDVGWLTEENIWVGGPYYDVQFAEAILDEQALVSLEALGRKYLNAGKSIDHVAEWAVKAYGDNNWKKNIYRCPPRLVGHYGQDDAILPIHILFKQWPYLERFGQLELFKMECASIPMLINMRRHGISVDVPAAHKLADEITAALPGMYTEIYRLSGVRMDKVMSPDQCAQVYNACGIPHQGSFRKEAMKALANEHPVVQLILDAREHEKIRSTFVESYILDRHRNGKIFCSFHPLKDDANGAKTGRYASSDPNLQNVSVRSKLGKRVRGIFIPDNGHKCWHKKDHSQIEYRIFSHYATDGGDGSAEKMRVRYRDNPATDYHQDTMDAVAPRMGKNLSSMSKDEIDAFRKPVKNINFGLLYGQTEKSLAYKAGMSPVEAAAFFKAYHTGRPFVRHTMKNIEAQVQRYGFIQTLLGRRCHFDQWEPKEYELRTMPTSLDKALKYFGADIQRAYAYRGVNYTFQGGAADILKKGMLECYESGVFDYVGYPKLQVHDELDWSQIDDSKATLDAFAFITQKLECAVQLSVPLKVDSSTGANWAACN